MKKTERKSFAFELKSTGEEGVFSGIASVYGNKDLQGDVVDRGAFTKTIAERGAEIPLLWQHDQGSPIGLGTVTDSPAGLLITGKLSIGTTKGKDAYELLKDRVVKGLSIGYETVKSNRRGDARHLTELKLFEVSCVTFPANEDALVGQVKAEGDEPADEEVAEQIEYATAAGLMAQLEASASAARVQIDALIASADASDEEEGARLDSLIAMLQQVVSAAYAVQSVAYRLNRPVEVSCDCGCNGYMSAPGPTCTKAGRVISSANHEKLKAAVDHMAKASDHVAAVIKAAAPKKPAVDTSKSSEAVISTPEPNAAADEALRALMGENIARLRAALA